MATVSLHHKASSVRSRLDTLAAVFDRVVCLLGPLRRCYLERGPIHLEVLGHGYPGLLLRRLLRPVLLDFPGSSLSSLLPRLDDIPSACRRVLNFLESGLQN
jgi:hypothetical protein